MLCLLRKLLLDRVSSHTLPFSLSVFTFALVLDRSLEPLPGSIDLTPTSLRFVLFSGGVVFSAHPLLITKMKMRCSFKRFALLETRFWRKNVIDSQCSDQRAAKISLDSSLGCVTRNDAESPSFCRVTSCFIQSENRRSKSRKAGFDSVLLQSVPSSGTVNSFLLRSEEEGHVPLLLFYLGLCDLDFLGEQVFLCELDFLGDE